jgi:hypothetical protein
MKCKGIDFIGYIDGHKSAEMQNHMSECPACREDLARLSIFMNKVIPAYKKGKSQEAELDCQLAAIDPASMKPLPLGIAEKVRAIKESSLIGRLKRIIGENREGVQELIESILHPQMDALPASPKDITQTKKAKPKQKKTLPKKRQIKKKSNEG